MREAKSGDILLLTLLGLIWGSSFFNIKIATYSYEPFTLALIRVVFACIPLFLLCKYKNIKIEASSGLSDEEIERMKKEAKLDKENKDIPFPGWDKLDAELNEKPTKIVLEII